MELQGRQILDILGKPLGLATKFISALTDGNSLKSQGGSHGGRYKPSPLTHSPMTSSPLIPAFVVLLVGFLVLSQSPIRVWLTEANDLPTLSGIFSFSRKKKAPSLPRAGEDVSVWTKKQSGFYYCRDGALFGNKPGEMMTQAEALTSGYRPVGGTYCANSQPVVASADAPSQQSSDAGGASVNATESSVLVAENQAETPVSSEDVRVWGLSKLGFYYCRGDTLFGVKPGRLMTQADALAEGLIPSYHSCYGSKANLASAGDSSSGTGQPSGTANASPHPTEPSTLVSENPAKADARVGVWVKKEFGFYYCRDDVLFGSKPGKIMSQADAILAGYQPSDSHCTGNKQNRATAERLSPHTFPRTK